MKLSFRNVVALTMALSSHSFASAGILQEHQGHWLGGMKVPDGRVMKIGTESFTRADVSLRNSFQAVSYGRYASSLREI